MYCPTFAHSHQLRQLYASINFFFACFVQFFYSKFVCQSDGREVTRVKTSGTVRLKLNISTKGKLLVEKRIKPNYEYTSLYEL